MRRPRVSVADAPYFEVVPFDDVGLPPLKFRIAPEPYPPATAHVHAYKQYLWDAEARAERERRYEISRRAEETRQSRKAARDAAAARFESLRHRYMWAYEQRLAGRSFGSIGEELSISAAAASQLVARAERYVRRAAGKVRPRAGLARPIDMGGPRDAWLTFYPPPDPRFDNMEPVSA
jgi:hypothetical protein